MPGHRLPDFVIAGAPKAGTTALHAALATHPQLYLSPVKEPKYYLTATGRRDDRDTAAPATRTAPASGCGAARSTWRSSTTPRPRP